MKFDRKTRKLFYENQLMFSCKTEFVKNVDGWLEFRDTVAFPEGGGQDSDVGIVTRNDIRIRFIDAKKLYAHYPRLEGFPDIRVDGVILHRVHEDDIEKIAFLKEGDLVEIEIDVRRRFENSLSHTASHLLYAAIGEVRPDVIPGTIGCHIRPGSARFDFFTKSRFIPENVSAIQEMASFLSEQNLEIFIVAHSEVPDARIWCCANYKIPCGGTHISSTSPIGNLIVRRKSLGASKERLSCEFPNAKDVIDSLKFLDVEIR
jgi:alanyl-tRNA synthetase